MVAGGAASPSGGSRASCRGGKATNLRTSANQASTKAESMTAAASTGCAAQMTCGASLGRSMVRGRASGVGRAREELELMGNMGVRT